MPTPRRPDSPKFAAAWLPFASVVSLLGIRDGSSHGPVTRRKREMIPPDKKDAAYWDKRLKNNELARRSREKRRMKDLILQGRLLALSEENAQLRAQVLRLRCHGSLSVEKSNVASGETLCQTQSPALFQPRVWGDSRSSPDNPSTFSRTLDGTGFDSHSHSCGTRQGLLPLSGPRVRSTDAYAHHVSASNAAPKAIYASSHHPFAHRAFVPTPDALHHASVFSYPGPSWLLPHPSAANIQLYNNFLLPWRSPYPTPPSCLPLYVQGEQGESVSLEEDIQREFKICLCGAPTPRGAVLTQDVPVL